MTSPVTRQATHSDHARLPARPDSTISGLTRGDILAAEREVARLHARLAGLSCHLEAMGMRGEAVAARDIRWQAAITLDRLRHVIRRVYAA